MSKNPFTYELKNASTGSSAEIQIYGYIGKWDEVDYPRFQQVFRDCLSKNNEVTIRIHSGGGSVYEGLAIYDLIRSSETKVKVIVEGMAASMASVIALAGDTIQMTENAFFMMHAVSGGCWGNKKDFENYIDQLANCENRLKTIYKERTRADEQTIENWFNSGQDHWLDSSKCKELSICDEVIKPTKTRKFDTENISNKTPEEAWQTIAASFQSDIPNVNLNNRTMKKETLVALLIASQMAGNINASSTDEDVEKQLKNVLEKAKNAETLQAQLDSFEQKEIDKVKAKIASAVAAGKIAGSEKAEWEKDAQENPAMVDRMLDKLPAKPNPNNLLNRTGKQVDSNQHELLNGREEWTLSEWQTKDPNGLARLAEEAPEDFDRVFNKK
ncbi:ATP-dependent Clp protease proteolytic subunit [Riemerella anatipestifer]|nr:ATP-dependent Clp protease proteolytic subunit [Riemerella anatipestifer]